MNKLLPLPRRGSQTLLITLLCLFINDLAFSQTNRLTWTGSASDNNFSTAANWTPNRVPSSTDNVIIEVNGPTIINLSNANTVNSLTINLKVVGNNKHTPNFTLDFNILSGASLNVLSDLTSSISIANSISSSDFEINLNVDGILTCEQNARFGINGDKDTVNVDGSGVIYFMGDVIFGQHSEFENLATVGLVFNGASAQTLTVNNQDVVPGIIVGDNSTASDLTIASPLSVNNVVVLNNATLQVDEDLDVNSSFLAGTGSTTSVASGAVISGAAFTLEQDADLTIQAASGLDGNIATSLLSLSKEANYTFTGAATTTGTSFPDSVNQLNINGVNLMLADDVTVTGALNLTTANSLNLNENYLTISGDYTSAGGEIIAGSSAVTTSGILINGSGSADPLVFQDGNNVLGDLILDRTLTGAEEISLSSTLQIANELTILEGDLTTGADTLVLLSTATISETGGSVVGNLNSIRTISPSVAETFGGLGVVITPVVNTPGSVSVTRTTGSEVMSPDETGFNAIKRIFNITASAGAGTYEADVLMFYEDNTEELNSITEANLRMLLSEDGGTVWQLLTSTLNSSSNSVSVSGLSNLGKLTAGTGFNPLPVSLINFSATRKDKDVVLEWSTASEQDCKGYEVEVSVNSAEGFEAVDFVASKNGNSNQQQNYSFLHLPQSTSGTLYYRLKQIDINGKASYYGPVAVTYTKEPAVAAWPNPFVNEVQLSLESDLVSEAEIKIFNLAGQQVYEHRVPVKSGSNMIQLGQLQELPYGVYMMSVYWNGTRVNRKLVKE